MSERVARLDEVVQTWGLPIAHKQHRRKTTRRDTTILFQGDSMNAATLSRYGVAAMTAPEFRAINGGEGTNVPPTTVGSTNLPPAGSTNAPSDKIRDRVPGAVLALKEILARHEHY
ncbi:MAG: hypothetical protein NTV22_08220 [bacterium]|nr:hypothetical protein [bacterium]